jgi:hypothetical protein
MKPGEYLNNFGIVSAFGCPERGAVRYASRTVVFVVSQRRLAEQCVSLLPARTRTRSF